MRYNIQGDSLPVVICELQPNESMITERGSMCWMSPNMKMETTSNGGVGKVIGRVFSGEAMFQNRYTALGSAGMIAFASSFPGSIRAVDISYGSPLIVQKSAFLASEPGVELSVFFQKRFGAGLFGGEGFIMQRLSGNGTAFVEIDGHAVEYDLAVGQEMVVDTGYLVAMSESCSMEIRKVTGSGMDFVKNAFFGGEGFFNTVVRGPGHIILQTMPMSRFAASVAPYIATGSN